MKKRKVFISVLLCAMLLLGLTACSSNEEGKDNVKDNRTVQESLDGDKGVDESENMESTENKENVENTGNAEEPEVAESTIPPSTVVTNSGMGIENGPFFVTPISDGNAFDATTADVIYLGDGEEDAGTGVIMNLEALESEYLVVGLDNYIVYLANGAYSDGEYEHRIEVHMDSLNAYETYYADKPVYEVEDDITFIYEYDNFYAIKKNDKHYLCATIYKAGTELDAEALNALKTELGNILRNSTFVDNEDPDFSTAYSFDELVFDCGWNAVGISELDIDTREIRFDYENEEADIGILITIKKFSGVDMMASIEDAEDEVYKAFGDDTGKFIGYIDTSKWDDKHMRYCIQTEDGSYMDVSIYEPFGNGSFDIHNWSEIEAILNSGK